MINIIDFLLEIPGTVKSAEEASVEKDGFSISAEIANSKAMEEVHVVMVTFRISHPSLLPEGVDDFSVATGRDESGALREAIKIWVEGALTVFLHLDKSNCNCSLVEEMELASLTENGDPVVWDLLRGPLQSMGEASTEELKGSFEHNVMLHYMLNDITGELNRNEALWVRAVITKSGDEISGDCYINNQFWEEGLRSLYYWADTWGHCEAPQVRRQFMICRPTDKEASAETVAQLKEQMVKQQESSTKKRWWKPWQK